ncbi:actin depolymerizing protein [Obba rivulosa]|uniref:Actin depolymerizing protein n=1 Tax=Obba rivulosa TaxID=1052685 RepID=A0A8E2J5A0_9APHY|nr:actin depolymerizing protein [Obba rivulosa]
MSAPTGITVSPELATAFSDVVDSQDTRFLKIAIRNESLVPDGAFPPSGSLEEDLDKLETILEDDIPAYVLVRLDDPPSEWLAVFYVPDNAKVRDKMLYAATRNTLTKSLGSTHFTDSLFATSKSDLSAEAYAKHRQHLAAPKPMSAREKEMAAVKAAEREAGGRGYEGSRVRQNLVGTGIDIKWPEDIHQAIEKLAAGEGSELLLLTIDPASESLVLSTHIECDIDALGTSLLASEPSYAFFAWPQSVTPTPHRLILFIYSCPETSPVKYRMLYSSGSSSVLQSAKEVISSLGSASTLASRKIETSDPKEINEQFVISELGLASASTTAPVDTVEKKAFARPKGPGRKR